MSYEKNSESFKEISLRNKKFEKPKHSENQVKTEVLLHFRQKLHFSEEEVLRDGTLNLMP